MKEQTTMTKIKPRIAIIGGGWLGKPLALILQRHYQVTVSCSRKESTLALQQQGLDAIQATLSTEAEGDWTQLLDQCETAVCLLPPNRGNHGQAGFDKQVTVLLEQLEQANVQNLLLVSATSIYRKSDKEITEESPLNPESSMYRAEQLVTNATINTTIVRFAGLISDARNPTRILSAKCQAGHIYNAGKTPVNLIHQQDCINIIQQIVKSACWNEVFNACSDVHLSREVFYQRSAAFLQLPAPQFNDKDSLPACQISNRKLKDKLNYEFVRNSLQQLIT